LGRHLRRLREGAAVLGIAVGASDAVLGEAVRSVVAANGWPDAVARITVTRGAGGRGVLPPKDVPPTLLVTVQPRAAAPETAAVIVAQSTRRNEFSPLSRVKSLAYLDAILARQEAAARGADEAVMLNTQGRVAEMSAANVFILRDGRLITPPVGEGALPGIARALLIEVLGGQEAPLLHADLGQADAVLLTNSLGVRAAASLDGVPLQRRPELERAARAALHDETGSLARPA